MDDSYVIAYTDKTLWSSMPTGFMEAKQSFYAKTLKNLKKVLVKDLKDVANHLNIALTKTVDGKKVSLHKEELVAAIQLHLNNSCL